jgi:hypothetical protein
MGGSRQVRTVLAAAARPMIRSASRSRNRRTVVSCGHGRFPPTAMTSPPAQPARRCRRSREFHLPPTGARNALRDRPEVISARRVISRSSRYRAQPRVERLDLTQPAQLPQRGDRDRFGVDPEMEALVVSRVRAAEPVLPRDTQSPGTQGWIWSGNRAQETAPELVGGMSTSHRRCAGSRTSSRGGRPGSSARRGSRTRC